MRLWWLVGVVVVVVAMAVVLMAVFATLLRAHSGRCPHLMTISPKRDRTIPIQIVEPCPGVPAWHDP